MGPDRNTSGDTPYLYLLASITSSMGSLITKISSPSQLDLDNSVLLIYSSSRRMHTGLCVPTDNDSHRPACVLRCRSSFTLLSLFDVIYSICVCVCRAQAHQPGTSGLLLVLETNSACEILRPLWLYLKKYNFTEDPNRSQKHCMFPVSTGGCCDLESYLATVKYLPALCPRLPSQPEQPRSDTDTCDLPSPARQRTLLTQRFLCRCSHRQCSRYQKEDGCYSHF